jgi:hypothetical protein
MEEEEYDSEDDESFEEVESPKSGDGEEDSDDSDKSDADGDVSMDAPIDKEEVDSGNVVKGKRITKGGPAVEGEKK